MSAITGSFVVGFSILLRPPVNFGILLTGVLICDIWESEVLVATADRDEKVLACLLDGFFSGCSLGLFEVLVLWNFLEVESNTGNELWVVGGFPEVNASALGRNRLDFRDCSAIGFSIVAIVSECWISKSSCSPVNFIRPRRGV